MSEPKEETSYLPEIRQDVDSSIVKPEKEQQEFFLKLQKFCSLLNKAVEADKLRPHPIVKDVQYLPISFMEMTLDELYFGLWNSRNFHYQQVGNEIVGHIELEVFHPIAKVWICRTGATGHQIPVDAIPDNLKNGMTKKQINEWALDLSNKKPAGLDNGAFASFKAECFRNACLSLGKYFGRDVNRNFVDSFNALIKPTDNDNKVNQLRRELSDKLSLCQDLELRTSIIDQVLEAEAKGTNTASLYSELIAKL